MEERRVKQSEISLSSSKNRSKPRRRLIATFQAFAPSLRDPISSPVDVLIGPRVEIQDISRYDIIGDSFRVFPFQVDFTDRRANFTLLARDSGYSVPRTGFAGYVIRFANLGSRKISGLQIPSSFNSIGMSRASFSRNRDSIFINFTESSLGQMNSFDGFRIRFEIT